MQLLLPDHRALLLPPACLPSPSCSPLRLRRLSRSSARRGLRVVSPETSNTVVTTDAATTGAQSETQRGSRFINERERFCSAGYLTELKAFITKLNHVLLYYTGDDAGADNTQWPAFAARVSGEWDGYGAEFTSSGEPVSLPENVVPEAYREWGVQVLDWQTQCPTLADPAAPCALHYRLVRLLPTVGCEADAATVHTSHQRHVASASAFAYAAAGSYVAAWPKGPAPVLEVEHCVVRPGGGSNGEVRVRVVQTVALGKEARLRGVKVFSEQWYGPFRNGEQLGGCAVRETAFAAGEKLDVSEVVGRWESTDAAAARFSGELDPETGKFAELAPDEPSTRSRDADGVVTLPKQLWSAFKEHGCDGEFLCEVGWVLGVGSTVTSRCVVSKDGDVKEIAVACESRVSEGT